MGLGKGTIYLVFLSPPSRLLPHKTAAFPSAEAAANSSFSLCSTPSSYQVAVLKNKQKSGGRGGGEGRRQAQTPRGPFDGTPCLGWIIIQKCFSLMSSENLSVLELRLQDEPHLWHQVKGKLEMTPTSSFPGQLLSHGTRLSRQIKINLKTNKKHKRVLCISMIPALIRLNEAGRLL